MLSNIEDLKSMIGSLSQKIDNLKIDTQVEKKIEELYAKHYEKNFEELYEKLYEKNIDVKVEKSIYEMTHSKLIDLLDSKFNQLEQKFEGPLREPKVYNKMGIYALTPRKSTTPTFSSTASTSSSGASTCSTTDLRKKFRF